MRKLLALLVFIAATAGRDAGAQPPAGARDSLLRAVAAAIRDEARASPDSAAWYVEPADSDARTLAIAVGVPLGREGGVAAPPQCPWETGRHGAPATGYAAAVRWLSMTADSARIAVTLRCANPSGSVHRNYWFERTYRIVRGDARWVATLETIGVTAITRPMPNVQCG